MKTKKFLMTSLLVMGMIIAKAANGFPPELVLVSQPVLTYNANSVTVYYDIQNIGDFTYRGDLYIYLDPDDGRWYARKHMRICPGRIKRVAVTIPAYRPNPSWVYTVMPYYELGNELFSFTTFEYFEPVSFCWYGYRNEPWVVFRVGPRVRHYHRPSPYRFYYDGYYPIAPPPPGGYPLGYFDHIKPLDPHHHTYHHHHTYGGYPANYHPNDNVPPGYNSYSEARVVRPGNNTPGSMSSNGAANNNGSATVVPKTGSNTSGSSSSNNAGNVNVRTGTSGRTDTGTSSNTSSESSRTGTTGRTDNESSSSSSNVSRPSTNSSSSTSSGRSENSSSSSNNSSSVSRPSTNSSSSSGSGRSGNSSNSSNNSSSVSRPSTNSSSSGRSGNSSNSSSNSGSSRGSSNTSSRGSSSSGRR